MTEEKARKEVVEWANQTLVMYGQSPTNVFIARTIIAMDAELKQLREDAKFVVSVSYPLVFRGRRDDISAAAIAHDPSTDESYITRCRRIFNLPEPPAAEKEGGLR